MDVRRCIVADVQDVLSWIRLPHEIEQAARLRNACVGRNEDMVEPCDAVHQQQAPDGLTAKVHVRRDDDGLSHLLRFMEQPHHSGARHELAFFLCEFERPQFLRYILSDTCVLHQPCIDVIECRLSRIECTLRKDARLCKRNTL